MVIIHSAVVHGATVQLVKIECRLSNGLPLTKIIGLGGKPILESRERLRAAIQSSKATYPRKRITLNLLPANLIKSGTSLDLAMAISILVTGAQVVQPPARSIFLGELGLDGSIRAVKGIIGILLEATANGITTFFLPQDNLSLAQKVPGLTIYAVHSLRQVIDHLNGTVMVTTYLSADAPHFEEPDANQFTIDQVHGQSNAKRALQIAAAGGHHILLTGPPGVGKTLLASTLAALLPDPSTDELLTIMYMQSLEGANPTGRRPIRQPHHLMTARQLVGSGNFNATLGEVSLAAGGVLLLNELPEFSRAAIESLRQPLDANGKAIGTSFILVATANPCPCGFYGTETACNCQPGQVSHYLQKLSGPLLDRIDLSCHTEPFIKSGALLTNISRSSINHHQAKATVQQARLSQQKRYGNLFGLNATVSDEVLRNNINLTAAANKMLESAGNQLCLSARAFLRTARVARTIADIELSASVKPMHITEALQYRHRTEVSK